jgi:tripartite-type tricarboxylate transporter receptor subunit TctC
MNKLIRAVSLATGLLAAGGAYAQGYPSKTIRLVNPYQAGGGIDLLARLVANKLQETWGQQAIVENKPGAGGNIAAEFVARSIPDGHTLLIAANTVTTNPYLYAKMRFDVQKDLAPISMLALQDVYLVANNNLPVKTVGDLIAFAKANPGKISYSTPGVGTPQHLGGELLKSRAEIDIMHVPYKGQTPAMQAVMAGEVDLTLATLNAAVPQVEAGNVKGLAITAGVRPSMFKGVPVVAETLPGYELNTWFAMFAPAGTPADVVQQLAAEIKRIMQLADIKEKLIPLNYEVFTSTSEELRATIAADLEKWGKVAKAARIKPE